MGELTRIDLPTGGFITYTYRLLTMQNPSPTVTVTDSRRAVASRTVNQGGTTATWNYSPTQSGTSIVTDPLGNDEVHLFSGISGPTGFSFGTYEKEVQSWQGSSASGAGGTLLKRIVNQYAAEGDPTPFTQTAANVRIIQQDTTLENGLTRRTQTDYETFSATFQGAAYTATYMNPTAQREYDFGAGTPGPLLRNTTYSYLHTGNQAYINANIVDRVTLTSVANGSGTVLEKMINEYDNYSHPSLPMQASSAVQHDSAFNTSYTLRGNVTAVQHWRNTDGVLLTTINQYDDAGNVIATQDSNGNVTHFDFTDSWSNATCAPAGQGKAYVTKITNAIGQITTHSYNSCVGSLASTINPNAQISTTTYDLLGRATSTSFPDGGSTATCYSDAPGATCYNASTPLTTTTTQKINASISSVATIVFDDLGRLKQTQLNSDPDGVTYVDTTYDAIGRKATVSNPHRSGTSATDGTTIYTYDPLSRTTRIVEPDGSSVNTIYSGNCTTVTDEANKARKSCADGLERLIQVFEDPSGLNYETDYQYDAIGNLLRVDQKGGSTNSANWRTRTFVYDSLSHLLTATNPESGIITYTYDANGNISTKTAPKPNSGQTGTVTTSYTYDALNRLTQKSYNDGATSTVKYGYDAVVPSGCTPVPPVVSDINPKGNRTAMCDASGATAWTHDSIGRILQENRTNNGHTLAVNYTYNFDGSLATLKYPSGRTVTYVPNSIGRTISAVDTVNNVNYVTDATYAPQGAMAFLVNGFVSGGFAGITTTDTYNNRLQPLGLISKVGSTSVASLTYDFHLGAGDNGDVLAITNNRDTTRSQTFTYDTLNRIATAQSQATSGANCWGNSYTIDPWGNLTNKTVTKCTAESLNASPATVQNQLPGLQYDLAGNVVTNGSASYTYDAENRVKTAGGVTYIYDGDGKRVNKSLGRLYWYGTGSATLTETDGAGNLLRDFIFFNGKRVARIDLPGGTVHYYFADHLGTLSVMANATGGIENDSDYYPYGSERVVQQNVSNEHYKFTGKEWDSESGLDDFGARYYASSFGRFSSPDPSALTSTNVTGPQRWNLYAYVVNNPLFYVDPDGRDSVSAIITIGRGSITFWVQGRKSVDIGEMVASAGIVETESFKNSIARNRSPFTQRSPDSGGGCVLGCLYSYSPEDIGFKIVISFNWNENSNVARSADITLETDPSAAFMRSNPSYRVEPTLLPGGLGLPPDWGGISISGGALEGLSDSELDALQHTVESQLSKAVYQAIWLALAQERERRKDLAKKLHDKCKQSGTCPPQGTPQVHSQNIGQ
jgi:RHS repeat-associated protein